MDSQSTSSGPRYDHEALSIYEAASQQIPAEWRTSGTLTADGIGRLRSGVNARTEVSTRAICERLQIDISHVSVPGEGGSPDQQLAVFKPTKPPPRGAAIYWVHGGGMVAGNRFGVDAFLLHLIAKYGLTLASVEYRLAPEHPHPIPVEDVYRGLDHFVTHAESLGFDPARVLLAGSSAGAGIAAAVALMARDRGGPPLAGQLLGCPMLDDRNASISAHQYSGVGMWDRESNETGWTALLNGAHGSDAVSGYAAAARATNLAELPPAFIDVGSAEVFRDEDVAYALGIWAAGGNAELHVWPGGFHGFSVSAPESALGRAANAAREDWICRTLALDTSRSKAQSDRT